MHYDFDQFFSQALNVPQQKVVSPLNGVLLVCAGAGSGKTRVITARMAYLMVKHDVQAESILALTFTNKAAREMKERIISFLPEYMSAPWVGTFHSYCLRLLKSNAHFLGFNNFSLLDDSDQEKLLKNLIAKYSLAKNVSLKTVKSYISRLKNEAITTHEREELYGHNQLLRDLYFAYEQEKTNAHCLDFDDLLSKTLELFTNNPSVKQRFQQKVRHVLVDEYQDTNRVQHALLKAMTCEDKNSFALDSLCVVGDEDQSIYSWRGATVTNIMNFNKDFPETMFVTIEQNYRSVQPILSLANIIIKHNSCRNNKNLWSDKKAHDRVRVLSCMSSYQEGEALALFLKSKNRELKSSSCAVLYRSHFQSRSLEEALIRHGIPYSIIGGIQFYDRLEIKDLLAYMRLVANPHDRIAFSRIINTPSRGLGDKFEELFYSHWEQQPFLTFKGVADLLLSSGALKKAKQDALATFLSIFAQMSTNHKPSKVLNTILVKTAYFDYLKESFDPEEATAKKENVKELINGITYFEEQYENATLDLFLQEVALLQEHMNRPAQEQDNVKLMTFHAAKGLEFDTVMLAGIEESILPSAHATYTPESLEEERRLLYVGITRARERLLISYTRYRYTYGNMTDQQPSRFIAELPEEHVEYAHCSLWRPDQFAHYFNDWLSPHNQQSAQKQYKAATLEGADHEWHCQQQVQHKSFGAGTIEKVEQKSEGKVYLTIRFKQTTKKIDSQFVQAV